MATDNKDFKVKNGLVVTNGGTFGGTVSVATPTLNDHATNKSYVDTLFSGSVSFDDKTSSQWSTLNPTLPLGTLGWESNTNKFKIGDGINLWSDLPYFIDEDTIGTSLGNYVETSLLAQPDGVATLDSSGKLESAQIPSLSSSNISDFNEAAQDAIGDLVGTGLSYSDSTGVISVDTAIIQVRVADVSDAEIGYLNGVTSGIQSQIDGKASSSHTHSQSDITNLSTDLASKAPSVSPTFTGTVILPSTTSIGDITSTEIGYLDGVTSSIQTQINNKLDKSGGTMTGYITLHADPSQALQAATKQYVDNAIEGLAWKEQVNLLSDTNVSLTGSTNTLVIDGHDALVSADNNLYRILLKGQTTTSENGIYLYTDNGTTYTLVRTSDADVYTELLGASVYVFEGTTYGGTAWIQSNYTLTSFSGQTWVQFSGGTSVTAGNGISVSGSQVSIDTAVTVDKNTAQTLTNKTLTSPTITGTGSIAGTFTGNLTGNVTGNVSGNAGTVTNGIYTTDVGTVTSTMIADGTIVDADISASAAIAVSKLASSSVTINGASITLGNSATITAANPNALTIGTGLSGTSYDGSSSVTIAIDSTITTLTGTQTLTNKTLTDSTTFFQDEADNTKKLQFQLSGITASNTRTLTVPDASGTIALTSNKLSSFASTTSAELASIISDETGTGSLVFSASPTFTGTVVLPSTTSIGNVSDTEIGYLDGVTSAIQTQLDAKAVYPSQTGNNGKYLTTNGSTVSWETVSGYSAPTLGTTSIASGATVTTISELTLSGATLTGTLTAGGSTGTTGQVLQSTGTGIQWVSSSGGGATVSSTAPSSPSQGQFWFNTSIPALLIYDGSFWVRIT